MKRNKPHRVPGYVTALWLAAGIGMGGTALAEETPVGEAPHIGVRRELFVDTYLIDQMDQVELRLHHPRPGGVALAFDRPWEGIYCAYTTVMKDGDTYRMYYRGNPGVEQDGNDVEVTCYAESTDGVHWSKPDLGLFEVMGTRSNNVVLAHMAPLSHNFSPFIDLRPGVPADQRYKATAGTAASGLVGFASPDGLRWKKMREEAVFKQSGWVFDSQNPAFWSESENCYLLYYRIVPDGIRSIARTTSPDFINWSRPVAMTYGGNPPTRRDQLYTNQTSPYFRAPHLYVALAARFMAGRQVLTPEQVDDISAKKDSWLGNDCSECVLMTTRAGTTRYDRTFMEGFVRPGRDLRDWGSRGNYPAFGIVQTGPREMSMYVRRHYGQPTHHLERLVMRLDGFISVHAPYRGGEMITRPFTFDGDTLVVNYATGASGGIRVEIQNEAGLALEGYGVNDCRELVGDEIERTVTWTGGSHLGAWAGRPLRLRFVMHDADLYALQFQPRETSHGGTSAIPAHDQGSTRNGGDPPARHGQ